MLIEVIYCFNTRTIMLLLNIIHSNISPFLTGFNPPANSSQRTGANEIWKTRAIYIYIIDSMIYLIGNEVYQWYILLKTRLHVQ